MHSAPSVRFPVGRCRFYAAVLLAAWLGAAVVTIAFILFPAETGWRQVSAAVVLSACGAVAAWSWCRTPSAELRWDGEQWHLDADSETGVAGAISVALDLQSVLLLRFSAPGVAASWHWLDSAADPPQWGDLRRAVYSRATIAAVRDPEEALRAEAAAAR